MEADFRLVQRFENHSKLIIGLERLMLESAGFDFRNRYPQELMVKMAKAVGFDKQKEAKTAWNLSLDLYRTFAPLKQTTTTLAIACVELAARLHEFDVANIVDAGAIKYSKWKTSRAEVMGASSVGFLELNGKLTPMRRNSARPPGSLHTPPKLHDHWAALQNRNYAQHPHNAEPRSRRSQDPALCLVCLGIFTGHQRHL